jgi:hypothetical protein
MSFLPPRFEIQTAVHTHSCMQRSSQPTLDGPLTSTTGTSLKIVGYMVGGSLGIAGDELLSGMGDALVSDPQTRSRCGDTLFE